MDFIKGEILAIDKPYGMTSFGALAHIRFLLSQKLTRRRAAEFSFFLAVPTMAAATGLDLLELFIGDDAVGTSWATTDNLIMLAVGSVVAFFVALFAMKWFVDFLSKYGFKWFGYYRIIVGVFILIWMLTGHSMVMFD